MRSVARRRFPIGVELGEDGSAHARVWAPGREQVRVAYGEGLKQTVALERETATGYFAGTVPDLKPGHRYAFLLDSEEKLYPDPASRFQPDGPHGPSEVVDPRRFRWTDQAWRGVPAATGQVIYELHLGTFTPEGTARAAIDKLPLLRELGVTVIELMPVAEFPGRFGWGYDGVDLWAPSHLYGQPDDLRRFVDAAHAVGLAVILDVVYNHLGPDGNYLGAFSPRYFSERYKNEWGDAINFDGPDAGPVRELFIENAAHWVDEYHFDGLRLDATQQMFDASADHIVAAIVRRVREAGRGRATYVIAENEPQETRLVRPAEAGGYGLDGVWNDDFHHSARVALTGHDEAYYSDYRGEPQELISALRWGYLYQGQRYKWQKKRRGTPTLDIPASRFVTYLENHDQVANSGQGLRLAQLTSPGRLRSVTALMLLGPGTPLLFQGQELGSTRPFLFFADHAGDLGRAVAKGRRQFLAQFPSLAAPEGQEALADPTDPATFTACKLDWNGRERDGALWRLHHDLLRLRCRDPTFATQDATRMYGAVLRDEAFLLRHLGNDAAGNGDRLVLVNLGRDLCLDVAPEPLLAPPFGMRWEVLWSSESPRYGGSGTPPIDRVGHEDREAEFFIPGESLLVLSPTLEVTTGRAGNEREAGK